MSFQSHGWDCWSCKSKVPELHFQAVLGIWPLLKSLHPRRLHNTCNPADAFQAVTWTVLVREENYLQHMMLLNTWVEFQLRTVHHSMSWEVPSAVCESPLLIGPSMRPDCPVRIPSAILCAKVLHVAPRCSSTMMFSMSSLARATCRGALAISNTSHKNCDRMESSWDLCPMIWRIQKRRQRCRRRLLKSTPAQCERV